MTVDVSERCRRISREDLAAAGIIAYSIGILSSTVVTYVGIALMLVAIVAKWPACSSRIVRAPLFWLSCGFLLYLLLFSLLLQDEFPGTLNKQIEGSIGWIRVGFFGALLVAGCLAICPRVLRCLPLLLAGEFMVRVVTRLPEWDMGLESRFGFGMPANAWGMYGAIVLFGLFCYGRRLLSSSDCIKSWRFWIWAAGVLFTYVMVMLTLSRSAVLAIYLVSIVYVLVLIARAGKLCKDSSGRYLAAILICMMTAGLLVFWQPLMMRSSAKDVRHVQSFLTDDAQARTADHIPSMGTRLVVWKEGVQMWLQRPFLGWGPRKSDYLLKTLWDKQNIVRVVDFHNSYFEVLVRLGLVGVLVFAAVLWQIMAALRAGLKAGWFDFDTAFMVIGSLFIFAFCAAFNDRISDHVGREFLSLYFGICYSHKLDNLFKAHA